MPRTFRVLVPSARRKKDPSRPGRARVTQARPVRGKEWLWTQGFRKGLERYLESWFGISGFVFS